MRRFLATLAAALLFSGCEGRPRTGSFAGASEPETYGDGTLVELDLSSGAPESRGSGGLFLPEPASRTYAGLVRVLEREAREKEASAFYVRFGDATFGWARTQELGRLLGKLRAGGKPVVCHADTLDNTSAWLAGAACDRLWLSPAGDVDAIGIAAQMVYFKGVLDKLKVEADFVHMGRYKSAVEPFTRDGPSEPARENLLSTLGSIRAAWLDGVGASRKASGARAAMEQGPWSASEARAHGLVDELGYESDALKDAKERGKVGRVKVAFGPGASDAPSSTLAELIRILSGADERTGGRPRIAVVPAEGSITMEPGRMLSSGGIDEKSMKKTLARLTKDESVKAVVLRIDSPGGSALASDLMWHELSLLRAKKPVVVSVGDLAASGGYYLACAGTRIVAEPTSIVGSIGVLGGKVALGAALAEYGIESYTFSPSPESGAAPRAAYLSVLTPWDDATRERVRAQMSGVYELFLKRVAAGRKLGVDEVRKLAEGRIYSGAQGKEVGLVDELGGLSRALEIARDLGKLDADAPVSVEGASESLIERLMVGPNASAEDVAAAARRVEAAPPLTRVLPRSLRVFAGSLEPLLGRERVLAALPFALEVR